MSNALDPQVKALVDAGNLVRLDLIRFDLPGRSVGYHRGGRPFVYNGLRYLPNRFLETGDMTGAVGVGVTTRTIKFSNVPTTDPDDAIAKIEQFNYLNAPVIVSHLAGVRETNEVIGALLTSIYEIDKVRFVKGAEQKDGTRSLTIRIDLQPPGRSARGATLVRRSLVEQQFDNDATDTSLEYASVVASDVEEWGQR
ncbi:DUF2163 domain-containing protein [Brucella pseudogrignonensis]|uniref:DUF2163 domain-containing protein n=1 Tax=Brucella pseudogrignonensis TaxID=419475 RepID=UPI0038D1FCE4